MTQELRIVKEKKHFNNDTQIDGKSADVTFCH
jgi:hypothetical protein